MSCLRYLRGTIVALACVNWILPGQFLMAATPTEARPTVMIRDVALSSDGRLLGQLVDSNGQAMAGQPVLVQQNARSPQRQVTDAQGRFTVPQLKAGVYQITAGNAVGVYRCWTAQAAPPAASREILLVEGNSLERGQMPLGEFFFSNPVLLGVIIAAAIAIPIAIHNSKDAS